FLIALVSVPIESPSHAPTRESRKYGKGHQAIFGRTGVLLFPFSSRQLTGFAFLLKDTSLLGKDGFQKFGKAVMPTQAVRPAQSPREYRKEGQHHQRSSHRLRRFMDVVLDFVAHARVAMKGQIHQAEHIERGHQSRSISDEPQPDISSVFR